MIDPETFAAQLAARGVTIKACNCDGPDEGRAVLADGTIVDPRRGLAHERGGQPDEAAAARYLSALAAHEPPPARKRKPNPARALALVVRELRGGAAAPAEAHAIVDALTAEDTIA